ncbi:zinc ribbon domain-containing protein [Bacillus cereus]|uniref:zinc ribbon domain-containing protein n=1 Tax=Bacillus cereus TaxID=1396 RepID=UPI000307D9AC
MKYCSKCSKTNDENSKFCSNCGEALSYKNQELINQTENVKSTKNEPVIISNKDIPGFKKQIIIISTILILLFTYSMIDMWKKHQNQVAHEKIQLEKKKKEEAELNKKNQELDDAESKAKFVINRMKNELDGTSEVSYDKETKTIKVANLFRMKHPNDMGKKATEDIITPFLQDAKDFKVQSPDHSYKIEYYYKDDPHNKYIIINDGNFMGGEWFKYLAGQTVKQIFQS